MMVSNQNALSLLALQPLLSTSVGSHSTPTYPIEVTDGDDLKQRQTVDLKQQKVAILNIDRGEEDSRNVW